VIEVRTLKSFGEVCIKPVEIKETWRVKFSPLNLKRPSHGKISSAIYSGGIL